MFTLFTQETSKKKAGWHTWGDCEGGLCAPAAAGDVGGNATVITSICLMHPGDLKDTTGQDCDSGDTHRYNPAFTKQTMDLLQNKCDS